MAQQVAMSEWGAVPLHLSPAEGLEDTVTVEPGEVVWRDTLQPRFAVRTLQEAPQRHRPTIDGAAIGDLLFGVQLQSGFAFCPPVDFNAPSRRVQCYRDFDDDGTFDGAYYTQHDGFRTQIIPARLRGLTAIRKTAFEPADASELVRVDAQWQFRRWRRGVAQFDYIIEEDRSGEPMNCESFEGAGENQCFIAGLVLEVVPVGRRGAQITLVGSVPQRELLIITRGS
jgi:hypothetical protein